MLPATLHTRLRPNAAWPSSGRSSCRLSATGRTVGSEAGSLYQPAGRLVLRRTGIGMARVASQPHADCAADIELCIAHVQNMPLAHADHVCCGEFGNIEFLLLAGQRLERSDLIADAQRRNDRVLARRKKMTARGEQVFIPSWPEPNPRLCRGSLMAWREWVIRCCGGCTGQNSICIDLGVTPSPPLRDAGCGINRFLILGLAASHWWVTMVGIKTSDWSFPGLRRILQS